MDDVIKLNIGSGNTSLEDQGYIPIDRNLGMEAFPLPVRVMSKYYGPGGNHEYVELADGSVDEIRASHILEHFPISDIPKVLAEWIRVLKPGARLFISVPDIDKILKLRTNGDPLWDRYLFGGQTDENDYHKSQFDRETLFAHMQNAGLTDIIEWEGSHDCSAHPCSLNLVGIKAEQSIPAEPKMEPKDIKIRAVCSIPRLGWNDHWGCVHDALRPFNIPVCRFTGAFWGNCLQTILESCVRDEVDWIITLDYDTMFSAQDLDLMFGTLGRHPSIDALAALQRKRNSESMLLSLNKDEAGKIEQFEDGPFKVRTAHFGLTILRRECLEKVAKPWFRGVPDEDGRWDTEGRIDPDIYFWKQWEKVGNSVYVHPHVRVGHLELMVTSYDEELSPETLSVGEWYTKYKPDTEHSGLLEPRATT